MVRLQLALTLLLAIQSANNNNHQALFVESFQQISSSFAASSFRKTSRTARQVASTSSSTASSDNSSNGGGSDVLGEALSSVTHAAVDSLSQAVMRDDEPDVDADDVARKQRLVRDRVRTYRVTLPLASGPARSRSTVLSLGITLCQVGRGRKLETTEELDLDTLGWASEDVDHDDRNNGTGAAAGLNGLPASSAGVVTRRMDATSLRRRIDGDFHGVVVSSVVEGSAGWVAGVRPGDILKTSSATLGSRQLWPKSSTLEGVRSAVMSSRRAVAESVQFEFQRLGEAVDNKFELTLTRPIGLELAETEDGYVEVTGFTPKASTLVQYAVKVGDRVVAVDSNMGDRMWPVSTVEGVISAVTTRLPGQKITFRFERSDANMATAVAVEPAMPATGTGTVGPISVALPETIAKLGTDEQLLERCREIMQRYSTDEKYINKFALPGLVADKVVQALASAETRVDPVTLSMIQTAYLSCRQPEMALRVFEAAVGLRADGSNRDVADVAAADDPAARAAAVHGEENPLAGKDDKRIVPNVKALDVYTSSALIKAHSMVGDLSAVQRVLAALEGRSETVVDGLQVAAWPGTGTEGALRPDTRCYNMVISAAADSGTNDGLALAVEIFGKLATPLTSSKAMTYDDNRHASPQKDIVSYNTVIKALSSRGRFQEAIETFYEMKKVGVKPDKFSYTSLVEAVMADADVEELLYDMKEEGVTPDAMTFNTIIRYLCERKKIVTARKIVSMMDSSGVAPDSWTYSYLMKGLMDCGNPSAALTLFETACSDRRTVGVTENVHLYTTAVSAAAAIGDHTRALELLSRMKRLGIKPNLKTMTALVGACLAAGKPELAVDVFRRIPNPDTYAVTQGLIAMAQAGHADEILHMLSDRTSVPGRMRGKGLMKVYEALFQASIDAGNYEVARNVADSLLSGGNIPSKALFQTIFEAMRLLPGKGLASRINYSRNGLIRRGEVDEAENQKFRFLLFVLDSVSGRKLPCEASLYCAILSFGQHLGGLPKKISALLVSAKSASGVFANKNKLIDEESLGSPSIAAGWEDIFARYDELKRQVVNPSSLPLLEVRVSSREVPLMLRAEKNLSYSSQKRNMKR